MDPLIAQNWYPVTIKELLKVKGAKTLLNAENFNLKRLLTQVYPDVKFVESSFHNLPCMCNT